MAKPVILFCPGMISSGYLHSMSLKLRLFFMRSNYDFKVVHAPLADSIEKRANYILNAIQPVKSDIHLVAHSMGGLSARYFCTRQNFISSLTTISTPHHGSIFADKYAKEPPRPDDNAFERAYKQLTSKAMLEWNKTCPNNPNVKYFSMGFEGDNMVTPESARWGTYLGTYKGEHLKQVSPYGLFTKTFKVVLDNLDSL